MKTNGSCSVLAEEGVVGVAEVGAVARRSSASTSAGAERADLDPAAVEGDAVAGVERRQPVAEVVDAVRQDRWDRSVKSKRVGRVREGDRVLCRCRRRRRTGRQGLIWTAGRSRDGAAGGKWVVKSTAVAWSSKVWTPTREKCVVFDGVVVR